MFSGARVSQVFTVYLFCLWAMTWQNQQNEYAPSEDSDQPWHPPSLIRVFTVHMKKPWVLSYPLRAQQRLGCPGWSESLLGAHPFCWFCHVMAQMHSYQCRYVSKNGVYKLKKKHLSSDLWPLQVISLVKADSNQTWGEHWWTSEKNHLAILQAEDGFLMWICWVYNLLGWETKWLGERAHSSHQENR